MVVRSVSVLLLTEAAKQGESSSPNLGLRAAAYSGLGESKLSTCTWWIENSALTPPCSRQVQAARRRTTYFRPAAYHLSLNQMEAPSSAAWRLTTPPSSVAERWVLLYL